MTKSARGRKPRMGYQKHLETKNWLNQAGSLRPLKCWTKKEIRLSLKMEVSPNSEQVKTTATMSINVPVFS